VPQHGAKAETEFTTDALKGSAMLHSLHKPLHPGRWELIKANMVVHAHEMYPDDEGQHEHLIKTLLGMSEPHKVRADSISWECWGHIVQQVHEHAAAVHPDDQDKRHRLELKLLGYA
jgi:hypothetical protein